MSEDDLYCLERKHMEDLFGKGPADPDFVGYPNELPLPPVSKPIVGVYLDLPAPF